MTPGEVAEHRALCACLGEHFPGVPGGDVFDYATRAVRRGLTAGALQSAYDLGGYQAVRALLFAEPSGETCGPPPKAVRT